MPAGSIRLACRIQHRSVVLLNVDAKASRMSGPENVRFVDVVDKYGDEHDVVITDDVGMSRGASSQLAKLGNCLCGITWAIDTYGPLKILPQFQVS
jgi:hypothetical protein